jgi:hypothetical protein
MKALLISSQNVRALLIVAALAVGASACGSSGGGGTGGAGTGGAACDVPGLFGTDTSKEGRGCAISACHGKATPAGNFDMETAGWETTMVGKTAPGGGAIPSTASKCGGMNRVYLVAGSNPATGLFLDKLGGHPSCGAVMPNIGVPLNAAELACVQTWANALTAPK